VKCRSAIDAIAAVYGGALGAPAQREGAGDRLRLFIAQVIQATTLAGLGRLPNQVLRIASRTNEPTPGE
jgi:hypothetical protein